MGAACRSPLCWVPRTRPTKLWRCRFATSKMLLAHLANSVHSASSYPGSPRPTVCHLVGLLHCSRSMATPRKPWCTRWTPACWSEKLRHSSACTFWLPNCCRGHAPSGTPTGQRTMPQSSVCSAISRFRCPLPKARARHARCAWLRNTPRRHLERPLAEVRHVQHPLQFLLHHRLTRRLDAAPLTQRRHQTRGDLAVHRIQRDDGIGKEAVAIAGWIVEPHLVGRRKACHERAHAIWIPQIEICMPRQHAHSPRRIRQRRHRLDREPFVQHQVVATPARMERIEGRLPFRTIDCRQHCQRCQYVSHILPCIELSLGAPYALGTPIRREIRQAGVAERAAPDRSAIDLVIARISEPLICCTQCGTHCIADCFARHVAHRV